MLKGRRENMQLLQNDKIISFRILLNSSQIIFLKNGGCKYIEIEVCAPKRTYIFLLIYIRLILVFKL